MISTKHLKRCGIRVVVLNGQASSWTNVKAGVPQGSMLGPLFSLNYINVLSESVKSTVKLFADDTSIFRPQYISRNFKP